MQTKRQTKSPGLLLKAFLFISIFFIGCSKSGTDTIPNPSGGGGGGSTVPSPPVTLNSTNIFSDGFNVNWSSVSGIDGYNLYIATDAGFTIPVAGYNPKSTASNSAVVLGLTPLTRYYVKVESVKNGIKSTAINSIVNTEDKAVYVCGWEETGAVGKAKYWKNGNEVILDVPSAFETISNAMCISDNDIYVVGAHKPTMSSEYLPTCWKNGVPVRLGYSYGIATGVCVSGSDVYACGYEIYQSWGCYWKNGVVVPIGGTANGGAIIRGISVIGNDVYLCGETGSATGNRATYWKNGVATQVTNTLSSDAVSLYIYNGDVYMSGYVTNGTTIAITYWKNGIEVPLTPPGQYNSTGGIFVSNGDVYVAGVEGYTTYASQAKYWKNGVPYNLLNATDDTPVGIFVSGNDVYVTGTEYHSNANRAKYWKNANPVYLGYGQAYQPSYGNGIVVK